LISYIEGFGSQPVTTYEGSEGSNQVYIDVNLDSGLYTLKEIDHMLKHMDKDKDIVLGFKSQVHQMATEIEQPSVMRIDEPSIVSLASFENVEHMPEYIDKTKNGSLRTKSHVTLCNTLKFWILKKIGKYDFIQFCDHANLE
jgi:hypothetical protein